MAVGWGSFVALPAAAQRGISGAGMSTRSAVGHSPADVETDSLAPLALAHAWPR